MTNNKIKVEFAKVLDLLKVSRCGNNDGEVLPISSGMVETDVVIRDLTVLNKMDGFETLRGKSSVPIVSVPTCIDYKILSSRPYVKISSEMLNFQDFSKILSEVLCQEECSIIIETHALEKIGESRLIKMLHMFSSSFNNSVRIILLVDDDTSVAVQKFVEKAFMGNEQSQLERMSLNNDCKRRLVDSRVFGSEGDSGCSTERETQTKVNALQTEISLLKRFNENKDKKICEGEMEASMLRDEVNALSVKVNESKQQYLKLSSELEDKKSYILKIESELCSVKQQLSCKEKILLQLNLSDELTESKSSVSTQTIPNSSTKNSVRNAEVIRKCIETSKITPYEALYRKIKHLKLNLSYSSVNSRIICEMEVLKGLEPFNLSVSKFTADGRSKNQAKNNCAKLLIAKLEEE